MKVIFFKLAIQSLINRKGSVLLTLLAIFVSVFVLMSVQQIQAQAKQGFNSTITGTDLIIGGRTGDINLLLYSVFHIGSATQNISWKSFQDIAHLPKVKWAVPLSLGDSHKGFRVTATTQDYFKHYQYSNEQNLQFESGYEFSDLYDVVIGAEVAKKLSYQLNSSLVLSHGIGKTSFSKHKDNPFKVVGVLKATGTPVDQSIYISMEAMKAIHIGWQSGVNLTANLAVNSEVNKEDLQPETVTAILVGLENKTATFRVQRAINNYKNEALLAILPGVTLAKLWQITSIVEKSLSVISFLVLFSALLGLAAMLLASIRERQKEIAVMRAMGATPLFVFLLIEMEVVFIVLLGGIGAQTTLFLSFFSMKVWMLNNYGIALTANLGGGEQTLIMILVVVSAMAIGIIPSLIAYKQALSTRLD